MRIVWKHLPLPIHADAPAAHMASIAAQRQGRFWEYHDLLFADRNKLKPDDLRAHARSLGLDMARFDKDFVDLANKAAMDADKQEAASLGVTGTPGFFINGRFLRGAKPFESFAKLINEELKAKGLPVPQEVASL